MPNDKVEPKQGAYVVVGVDMWESSKRWPATRDGMWNAEAVIAHNTKTDEIFVKVCKDHDVTGGMRGPSQGDGRMYLFPALSAKASVHFDEQILAAFPFVPARPQKAADDNRRDPEVPPIETSVAVAFGHVTLSSDTVGEVDYRGWPVDVATRLVMVAGAGQVLADAGARDVFLEMPLEIDSNTWTRLPAVGTSWDWQVVSVFQAWRNGGTSKPLRNLQVRMEQLIVAQKHAAKTYNSFMETWKNHAIKYALQTSERFDASMLGELSQTAEELVGTASAFETFLDYFPVGPEPKNRERMPIRNQYDELARDPVVIDEVNSLRDDARELAVEVVKHYGAGRPNLRSPLASGDVELRTEAATKVLDLFGAAESDLCNMAGTKLPNLFTELRALGPRVS